jgi:hypothetical protein
MKILQEKALDASAEESRNGFFRRVDDGLPLHIEAGVEHHLATSGFAHGHEQRMKVRIFFYADGLQARRAVDVRDGGKLGAGRNLNRVQFSGDRPLGEVRCPLRTRHRWKPARPRRRFLLRLAFTRVSGIPPMGVIVEVSNPVGKLLMRDDLAVYFTPR